MRTELVLLLAFAAAAAVAVSASRDVDGGSISGEPSAHLQAETILEGIAAAVLGESPASRASRKRLDLIPAASPGTDDTGADVSAESWSFSEMIETRGAAGNDISIAGSNEPTAEASGAIPRDNGAMPGTKSSLAGTSGTIVGTNSSGAGRNGTTPRANGDVSGTNGTIAGRNAILPPDLFSPWSLTEILNGIAMAIESERKLRRAVADAMPSPPSKKGSSMPSADGLASGCASLVLGMAPCVMDIAESSADSALQMPSGRCCSAVLAVSTPSAAGGPACACHLLRDPPMLDLQLSVDRVDALFSACDGRHFTNGSFAKLCRETKTLPPLVMYLAPAPANVTDSIPVPEPDDPAVEQPPATNSSSEAPRSSGVAESMVGGGAGGRRRLLLLIFIWSAYLVMRGRERESRN